VPSDRPLALRALARLWWIVLVFAILAAAGAVLVNESSPRDYRAEAQILVTPIASDDQTFLTIPALRQTGDTPRLIQTAAALIDSHEARDRTARDVGEEGDDASIDVQAKGASNIIAVSVTAPKARRAARVANSFARNALAVRAEQLGKRFDSAIAHNARQLKRYRRSTSDYALGLRQRLDVLRVAKKSGGDPTLSLSQTADVPDDREGPPGWLVIVAAVLGGAALGFALILLLEAIRPGKPAGT
jgi:uncharacterized protein involved in exopolysaccharide biosynthesis